MLRISAIPGMLWSRRLIVQSAMPRTSLGAMYPGSPSFRVERTPTSRISPISEATGVMNGCTPSGSCCRTLQALLHLRARIVDVRVPAELDIDEGKRHVAVRPQAGEPGHAHQRAFDRLGDARLHLLRSEARRFG